MSVKDPLRNPYPNFLEDNRLWNFLKKLDAEAKAAAAKAAAAEAAAAEEPAAAAEAAAAEEPAAAMNKAINAPASALQQSSQLSLTAPLAVPSKRNNIPTMGLKSNNRSALPHGASGLSSSSAQTPLGTTPGALSQVRPPIDALNATIRQIQQQRPGTAAAAVPSPAAQQWRLQQLRNRVLQSRQKPVAASAAVAAAVAAAPDVSLDLSAAPALKSSGLNTTLSQNPLYQNPDAFSGGARKYPAKKYRFASRKHSKRCKTTSHKKACRRKSHKHRRITRKR